MSSNLFLSNKVVAITGGGRGIGCALAKAALACGASVAVLDINPAYLITLPDGMMTFEGDVGQRATIEVFYQTILEQFGQLDYIVANAITTSQQPHEDEEAFFDRMIQVNFKGMYYTLKLALPLLAEQGAMVSMLAASAIHDIYTTEGTWAEYTAMKQAVKYLSRNLAAHNERGIRINMVSPGFIEGERVTALSQRAGWKQADLVNTTAVKHMGTNEDIIRAVLFLLSPESRFITGEDLWVDGGWAIKGGQLP